MPRRTRIGGIALVVLGGVVAAVPAQAEEDPPPTPDPGRIAFSSDRFAEDDLPSSTDLVVMDADGSNPTRVTHEPGYAESPDWAPDAGSIVYGGGRWAPAFVEWPCDQWDAVLFLGGDLIRSDGASRTVVAASNHPSCSSSASATGYSEPTSSLDGTLGWVFHGRVDGPGAFDPPYAAVQVNGQQYVDPEGGPPQHSSPALSPDGSKVAVVEGGDIFVVDIATEAFTLLVEDATDPAWSPDGTQLAYVSGDELHRMPAVGGAPTPITSGFGSVATPTWSPDGTRLAFATDTDGDWEIYAVDVDGSDAVNLTDDPAADRHPDWSGPCDGPCADLQPPPGEVPDPPTGIELLRIPADLVPNADLGLSYAPATTGAAADHHEVTFLPDGAPFTSDHSPTRVPDAVDQREGRRLTVSVVAVNGAGSSEPAVATTQVPCTTLGGSPFHDVASWADAGVAWLAANDYAEGFPDNTFRPGQPSSRRQFVRMAFLVFGPLDTSGLPDHGFVDVGSQLDDAVRWLHAEGVMDGFGDRFRPGQVLTRGQVARALYRIAGSPDRTDLPPHGLSDVPDWLDDAVTWLVANDLASGYSDGTFRAQRTMTRGALARMLHRQACPDIVPYLP